MSRLSAYQLGAEELAIAANAPITSSQARAGKAELLKMRRSLVAWLRFRAMNDKIATGDAAMLATPLLRKPGAVPPPAAVMALRLRRDRYAYESELAAQLYQLLSEVHDSSKLPAPDIEKNPAAAVQLAQIAISGVLPGETVAPQAQGFVWMWPAVVVIGVIAFVIMTAIKSSADAAAERERLECIKAGKCTDSGFWLKVGAIAVTAWVAYDKFGIGKGLVKKSRA
jgi:hypothetical protein